MYKNIYSSKNQTQKEVNIAIEKLKEFIKSNHLQVFDVYIYENINYYWQKPCWKWKKNPFLQILKNKSQTYSLICHETCEGGVTIAIDWFEKKSRLSGWCCKDARYKFIPAKIDYNLKVGKDITNAAMSFMGLN